MALAGAGHAGNGGSGASSVGDTLNNPRGIWKEPLLRKEDEDTAGLYLVDKGNGKIRSITWELKTYDYYGGTAEIHTLHPASFPTAVPTAIPTVVPTFGPTAGKQSNDHSDSSSSSSSSSTKGHSNSSVVLIVVITVCVLLLLCVILLCVSRYLYDWPSFIPSSPRSRQQQQDVELSTYRLVPTNEGTSPI